MAPGPLARHRRERPGHDAKLIAALKPLIGAIPVKTMQAANLRGSQGTVPAEVATRLWDKIVKK